MKSSSQKRLKRERNFKRLGLVTLTLTLLFLGFIFGKIFLTGYSAFFVTEINVAAQHPEFLNPYAPYIRKTGDWIVASDEVNMYMKHGETGHLTPTQIQTLEKLKEEKQIRVSFNTGFFTHSDSREPELAGIWGGVLGSIFTLLITFFTAIPLGIGTAIYMEEYAPKNRLTHFIEANINNLAAVPSILFGLLAIVIFIHFMGLPRPSAVVGGLTLGLMSLPIIVVATRAALASVPFALKEAALGLGATRMQVLFHHIIPSAMPGITTGVILSLARALGETAPLLMLGMVAFIANPPHSFLDPTTVLPVQIYNWSRSPEIGFVENTSGAILVLLIILGCLNGIAIFIRKKYESLHGN